MDKEIFNRDKDIDIKMKTSKFASKLHYKSKRKIAHGSKAKMPITSKFKGKINKYEIKTGNLNHAIQDNLNSGINGRNFNSNTPSNMMTTNNMLNLQSNMSKDIMQQLAIK